MSEIRPEVIVRPISWEFVHRWDKLCINTNNLSKVAPDDYYEFLDATKTTNWVYRFHDPEKVRTLRLDAEDLEWMQKARRIGRLTRAFSELFREELEETVQKYAADTEWISSTTESPWFVRTERVSLKNGQHGTGPYTSLRQVLESLVSSNPGHDCFNDGDTEATLYFLPFLRDLDPMKEFRVFIYEGEVTAISQQALYTENPWLTSLYEEGRIPYLVQKILEYYAREVKPRMEMGEPVYRNYTMDLALLGQDLEPYFIEPNSFGAKYSAGSALFGWEQDAETLHCSESVEFRFTIQSQSQSH